MSFSFLLSSLLFSCRTRSSCDLHRFTEGRGGHMRSCALGLSDFPLVVHSYFEERLTISILIFKLS